MLKRDGTADRGIATENCNCGGEEKALVVRPGNKEIQGTETDKKEGQGCDWACGSGWNAGVGHHGAQIAAIMIVRQRNLLKIAQQGKTQCC